MIPVENYSDFLRGFTDRTPLPTTAEGHLRSDLRALFASALSVEPSLQQRASYHEEVIDREWERFTSTEKGLIFQGVLAQLKKGERLSEWMVGLLMRAGSREINTQVLQETSKKAAGPTYGYANQQLVSFMTIVAALPAGSDLLGQALDSLVSGNILTSADSFKTGQFNTDDVVIFLKKLQPLQSTRADDYNTVVERFIHGMVAHGNNELAICRLAHAEIPFDPVACLDKMARLREESWPMVLRLVEKLTSLEDRREQVLRTSHYHAERQERVLWDPEWRNPELAGEITAAFMGWMEKKKNRIPRPLFSGNFLATLASKPEITTIVPEFYSRALALWQKNVAPDDLMGSARTLVLLWSGLSQENRSSSLALIDERLRDSPGEGVALNSETFNVLSILGSCDLPETWLNSFLPRVGAAADAGFVFPQNLGGLSVLAKTHAGSVAVSDWLVRLLQGQHAADISSITQTAQGKSTNTSAALAWIQALAHPSNNIALSALQKHDRLTDIMTLATMSFLTDKTVAYLPKNAALEQYASLMSVLGDNDFMEKFDAAYDLDVGRHGFASLLAALSPVKGRGLWSTAEALYMDSIVDGTLVTRPEMRQMIHDLVGEVFDPARQVQAYELDLPDIGL